MPLIRIKCTNPRCNTLLSISASLAGQRAKCSCCGQMVRVPDRPSLRKKSTRAA